MWKARNAWQCALALFIADIVTSLMVRLAWRHGSSSEWLAAHESSVNLALKFYRASLWLFFAFWFSGDRLVLGFSEKIGLMRRPNLTGWLAAWVSVGLGLFALHGTASGWTPPNQVARRFAAGGGLASWGFFCL